MRFAPLAAASNMRLAATPSPAKSAFRSGRSTANFKTLAPGEVPVKQAGVHCWLLDRGRQIPLKVGLNSVGRLPDNDIVIDDATVSRRHCAIVVHSDLTIEIHDVASKNGTLSTAGNSKARPDSATATKSASPNGDSPSSCSPARRPAPPVPRVPITPRSMTARLAG